MSFVFALLWRVFLEDCASTYKEWNASRDLDEVDVFYTTFSHGSLNQNLFLRGKQNTRVKEYFLSVTFNQMYMYTALSVVKVGSMLNV
jgi:hypothetical protein